MHAIPFQNTAVTSTPRMFARCRKAPTKGETIESAMYGSEPSTPQAT